MEQQFVCVRLVQMNGADLRLFQFDYDQTWTVFFLNADGSIYGRYGTRAGTGRPHPEPLSVASLKKAMERALGLHRGYPGNRTRLAGKLGPEPKFRYPQQIPGLHSKPPRATATGHGTCIHCHEVRDATLRYQWENRRLRPEDVWVYPLPENVGVKIEVEDGLRVASIAPNSPAARAEIRPGDALLTMGGQPLVSQADIQWVLHGAPAQAQIPVIFSRGGQTLARTLNLGGNWRETDISWRESTGPGLSYGMWAIPLTPQEKQQRGIPEGNLALLVRDLFAPRATTLRQAGLRPGDVILGADGRTDFANKGQLMAYVRLNHPPGDRVRFLLWRGGQQVELAAPMW